MVLLKGNAALLQAALKMGFVKSLPLNNKKVVAEM